jgi:hypothetical protein
MLPQERDDWGQGAVESRAVDRLRLGKWEKAISAREAESH